jgi:enoyl-CoA hydratase/carnithine racemase
MSIVITEDRGPVRHVVLNRPEKRNAMSQELLRALGEALREAAYEESVHCVVLRGEGPVFSAGVDLGELASFAGKPSVSRQFRDVFLECANACEAMLKPVVCQIHRTCVGGALEVALGADLRIASNDAQLGLPEVKFGIIPDVGGSSRLPAVVGLGRAKELVMTGRLIDAGEAERIGLVNRVVAPKELEQATHALVDELLANSHVAVGRAKRVMDASARPALAQTLELEVAVQEYCMAAMRQAATVEAAGERAAMGEPADENTATGLPADESAATGEAAGERAPSAQSAG